MTLATYRRTGGRRPSLNEQLEIDDEGTFRMERRVSADRAGSFAGTVPDARLDQLRDALPALGEPVVIRPTRPGVVLEVVHWAGGSASFPLEDDEIPQPWLRLRELLHALVEDLKACPVAALDIALSESADTVILSAIGEQAVRVDVGGSVFALSLFGEDEDYLGSAQVAVPGGIGGAEPLRPGWRQEVALDHGLAFTPKRTLQLSVDLTIDGRASQLSCTAGKGWF